MRVAIVRHGDATTTRGHVLAFSAEIHDNGRKVALFGDQATCGNCPGLWKIAGTGEGVGEGVRAVVVNGDYVLCPCGKNRTLAGADAGMFMEIHVDAISKVPRAATHDSSNGLANQWIAFKLSEPTSCAGLRCVAHFEDGDTDVGTFDANNTVRFERSDNSNLCKRLELMPRESTTGAACVTQSLLDAIGG